MHRRTPILPKSVSLGLFYISQVEIEDEEAETWVDRGDLAREWSGCDIRALSSWSGGFREGVYGPVRSFEALY